MKRPQPPGWIVLVPVGWAVLGVLFLFFIGWLIGPVHAQGMPCGKTRDLEQGLANIGERVIAEGVTANGIVMQLWGHPQARTFTVTVRMPDGKSCMVISGDGLEEGKAPEGKPL